MELVAVHRSYPGRPLVRALRPTDLSIHSGDYVAIVGPSGSGKSTLLHLLGLLDTPTGGTYRLNGIDIRDINEWQRSELRARSIGFIFQAFHLLQERTALDNVMLGDLYSRSFTTSVRRVESRHALERVGLGRRIEVLPSTMSGGERQRVAIARAILGDPDVLLADEPTGNLDSKSSGLVMDLLGELNQEGKTLIVITHDEAVAARAGRRLEIRDGAVTESTGSASEPVA